MVYRTLLLGLLAFLISINSANASESEKQLLILYTSDMKGYVEGCG